ncbi:ATP-binding cassette domain-containing protein [Microbacterium protaetiae]|uniref:ABC transporter ATP-binding protein/permease n=1 Tax=Microbacterium protaetiae TaxID=2509458 RepID=UPI0013EDF0A9|nr:ATP-binding cassette domain-containing protein [Microbacterium protaetiae]
MRDISFNIRRGEFVGIIGPSGAGKSTLLNILGLLDSPTAGAYRFDGVDITDLGENDRDRVRNEKIGFIFQDSHTLVDETAAENVSLPLKIRGATMGERRRVARTELRRLGLGHRQGEAALNLSGGERQRVAIARAISTHPALVLADEPTGSLDSASSAHVIDELRALNTTGTTVVIITHDRAIADRTDRCIELLDGRVAADPSVDSRAETWTAARAKPDSAAAWVDAPASAPALEKRRGSTCARFGRRLLAEAFDAISAHTANLGRTVLLLAAFSLGVGGLVCAMGVSQSAASQVSDQLTQAGLDEVVAQVSASGIQLQDFDSDSPLPTHRTVTELQGVIGAAYAARVQTADARPRLLRAMPAARFDGDILVAGPAYLAIQNAVVWPTNAGRLLSNTWHGAVAILGKDAAAAIGVADAGPGVRIWIADQPVDVVGLITAPGRTPLLSNTILLSPEAAVGLAPEDARLIVRTAPGMPAAVADALPPAISPGNPPAVTVETVADLRQLRHGVSADLGILIALVSALLLLLACLTSAVAMYLSVRSRRPEIALRRAIGASRASIWRLFTVEGLTVGLGGGVAGAALGLMAVVTVCAVQQWTPVLDLRIVFVGIGIGAASGIVSAVYPATAAARSNPALAIRA